MLKTFNNESYKGISIRVVGKIIGNQEKVVGNFWYNKKAQEVIADTKADLMVRIRRMIG